MPSATGTSICMAQHGPPACVIWVLVWQREMLHDVCKLTLWTMYTSIMHCSNRHCFVLFLDCVLLYIIINYDAISCNIHEAIMNYD